MASKPARIWMGTLPFTANEHFGEKLESLVNDQLIVYSRGQREMGESGYEHWQFIIYLKKPQRLSWLKKEIHCGSHWEPTRSEAADEYVWKDATSIPGTRFEFGIKSMRRNVAKDWDQIVVDAKNGRMDNIPGDILVRCYGNLKRIAADNLQPLAIERTVYVFWGRTGTGKSRRAWDEAGLDAYPKDPRTKFWDGYNGQQHVIIDEFRGGIDISHMLRWLDRYPVIVEIKGSSTVLKAKTIWITSNKNPREWYVDLDEETKDALLRRLNITEFIY